MLTRRQLLALENTKQSQGNQDADILIHIFQRGAADGLNLIVPYFDSNYYTHRPNLAIPTPGSGTGSALDLDGFFGLHPNLSALLPIYQNQDLAMVHACGSLDSNHSHFESQDFVDRGSVSLDDTSGWLARYANSYNDEQSTAFKSVGMSSSVPNSLASAEPVVALTSIDGFNIIAPENEIGLLTSQISNMYLGNSSLDKAAQSTFSALNTIQGLNPEDYPIENNAVYPDTDFGIKMRDLAVLIKSGIGIEVASVDIGGWDTHDNQAVQLDQLAQDYADTVAAFYYDMGDRMANISMITITEFGRRVIENGSNGTDHGTGNVAFIMGGGVKQAQVYSDWPGLGFSDLVGPGDLQATTDYRTIIAELMDKRMFYNDHPNLFPDFEIPEYLDLFITKP